MPRRLLFFLAGFLLVSFVLFWYNRLKLRIRTTANHISGQAWNLVENTRSCNERSNQPAQLLPSILAFPKSLVPRQWPVWGP